MHRNMVRGFTIILFSHLLKCFNMDFDWRDALLHLDRWLEGLVRALPSQGRPSARKKQRKRSCSHGGRLCFDGPHEFFVVHTSVPLPQDGREALTRKGCSLVAQISQRGASRSSATQSLCSQIKDASIAVWDWSDYLATPSVPSVQSHQGNQPVIDTDGSDVAVRSRENVEVFSICAAPPAPLSRT